MKFTATIVDEDQAGRPFPVRPITENGQLVRWNHQRAAAYLTDVRLFWADVAAANMRLYDAGCVEALHDVREALANAGPIPASEEPPLTARHIFNACEATGPMPAEALAELDVDTLFALRAMYHEMDLGMGGQFAEERRAVEAECTNRLEQLKAQLTGP